MSCSTVRVTSLCPGRGMGVLDRRIKIIQNVDPGDIHQGSVVDCWLPLRDIALAEFDAIFELSKKTRTRCGPGPNRYHTLST